MKKRIIVVGILNIIFIISFMLFITYGYLNNNIQGNSSKNSVVVDLKNNKVEFTDLLTNDTNKLIEPGFADIKLFTVKNMGNTSAKYNIYLYDVINTFVREKDLQYTLYRKNGNNTIDINNLNNEDIIATGQFPKNDLYIKIAEILNNKNDIYTYALKTVYINSEENQDANKGKEFSFKIQIDGEIDSNKMNLANTIINNAKNVTDEQKSMLYAEYSETPKSSPAAQISGLNESTLSKTRDDYGDSYYFRGNTTNNYINFANMCWRIVRISGNGTIKIILEDEDTKCEDIDYNNGDGNWNIPTTTGGSKRQGVFGRDNTKYSGINIESYINPPVNVNISMVTAFKDFENNVLSGYLNKLVSGGWCYENRAYLDQTGENLILDRSTYYENGTDFYYDSFVRLEGKSQKEPTLKCNGIILDKYSDNTDMYVGTITADEAVFAGGKINTDNLNYYLVNSWHKNNSARFWTLTLGRFYQQIDYSHLLAYNGRIERRGVSYNAGSFRPSVNLSFNVNFIFGGDGTQSNPYEIS